MIIKRFVCGELEANGYVIYNCQGGDCYIIDAGYNGEDFIKFINENNLNPIGVIFTHHHYDHITEGPKIAEAFGCNMYINNRDFEAAKNTLKEGSKKLIPFQEGYVFKLEENELETFNMPGHTKGGTCIVDKKNQVAFTGDTIFATEIGITDLEDGSPEEMAKSCYEINKWDDDIKIYPGHGESAYMGFVKSQNDEFKQALNMVK